jgi:alkylation response protein AidB-like acyl-CoA dehydrogenase
MRTIAQCTMAFDMMCERALSRQSHGAVISEHQMVQEKIAESYAKLKMLRLYVLETAWKMDQTSALECRTDIAAVKFTISRVLREISFDALQIHGALGTTDLTPLQEMYASAPTMGIADGADEVHKTTVARRILRDYEPHEGDFPREFIPYKKEAAWKKMQPIFDANPELAEAAQRWKKFRENRGR